MFGVNQMQNRGHSGCKCIPTQIGRTARAQIDWVSVSGFVVPHLIGHFSLGPNTRTSGPFDCLAQHFKFSSAVNKLHLLPPHLLLL